jgi:erythromycin esterase-like protein
MPDLHHGRIVDSLRRLVHPLTGAPADYAPLLEQLGDARLVLLGEASHGTHEFYRERAAMTKWLIQEQGFTAVAVEADWPDAYRVNCYARGEGSDPSADAALGGFKRFPTWMWRNTILLSFVTWLRAHNAALSTGAPRVGFYGLDLYSLYASIEAVLSYLDRVDPAAARQARARYGCFEHFNEDTQAYGYAASFGLTEPCQREVISQLIELQQRAVEYARRDGRIAEDDFFSAEQNARLVKNAEEYHRTMFLGRVSSWNLRDCHMAETLDALLAHLDRQGRRTKAVVWAHNSHLGDARATEMGRRGELNLGQLVRERYGREAVLVGFTTYSGTVTAASDWGGPAERKQVRPGLPGSYEALFHAAASGGGEQRSSPAFLLPLQGDAAPSLDQPRLQRAIGVIYRPETERLSHYFEAQLPRQFDALLHFDETRALEPLEPTTGWQTGEAPETYPTGDVPPRR